MEDQMKWLYEEIVEWDRKEGERGLMDDECNIQDRKKEEFYRLSVMEEIKCKQKSKIQWHKEGDNNAKFFHLMATSRMNNNNIVGMKIEWVCINDGGRINSPVVELF